MFPPLRERGARSLSFPAEGFPPAPGWGAVFVPPSLAVCSLPRGFPHQGTGWSSPLLRSPGPIPGVCAGPGGTGALACGGHVRTEPSAALNAGAASLYSSGLRAAGESEDTPPAPSKAAEVATREGGQQRSPRTSVRTMHPKTLASPAAGVKRLCEEHGRGPSRPGATRPSTLHPLRRWGGSSGLVARAPGLRRTTAGRPGQGLPRPSPSALGHLTKAALDRSFKREQVMVSSQSYHGNAQPRLHLPGSPRWQPPQEEPGTLGCPPCPPPSHGPPGHLPWREAQDAGSPGPCPWRSTQ